MSDYPIESLLRPPVEYFAAGTHAAIATIALAAPEAFMLVPSVSYATASALALRGGYRYLQGRRIRKYQKGLWRLPHYTLHSTQIPVSNKKLFLGRGFAWDERHTQRLADTERRKFRKYRKPSLFYRKARLFEIEHEHSRWLKRGDAVPWWRPSLPLLDLLQSDSRFNPVRPLPPVGGNAAIHAVGLLEGESPIYMDLADRVGHTLVLGTTRVGKTRLAELFVTQDIHRGDVVIVFDPKGDHALLRRMYVEAKRAGRLDDFYCFHLGFPNISARYNPVGNFTRVTEVASRIAGQLPSKGQSQAFREFVWRYVNGIAKAMTALGRKPNYESIKYFGEDIEPLFVDYLEFYLEQHNHQNGLWREILDGFEQGFKNGDDGFRKDRRQGERTNRAHALQKYFKDYGIEDFIAHSLLKTFEYEKGYLDKLVGSLLPLMEKLCTGKTAELLSPDYLDIEDPRPIFDWPQIIRTGGIVYVGLDGLSDPEVAAAVGNSMFADLTAGAGRIYKSGVSQGLPNVGDVERAVNIHADEFNELIGEEFIPLLNKAGGAGFQVTAYTQTWSDILARLGDKAKAGQVTGNLNTKVLMRVLEPETAELLTQQLKQVQIDQLMAISRATDSSVPDSDTHFVSATEQRSTSQRVDQIHPNDLNQLPKGQCFALLDGGFPHKIRLPYADPADLDGVPRDIALMADEMKRNYTTSDDWYRYTPSFVMREAA